MPPQRNVESSSIFLSGFVGLLSSSTQDVADMIITLGGCADSSDQGSRGLAKTERRSIMGLGLESRAPSIGAMGCAMQAIPPMKSGR